MYIYVKLSSFIYYNIIMNQIKKNIYKFQTNLIDSINKSIKYDRQNFKKFSEITSYCYYWVFDIRIILYYGVL